MLIPLTADTTAYTADTTRLTADMTQIEISSIGLDGAPIAVDFGAAFRIPEARIVDEADLLAYASGVMIPAPFLIGKAMVSTEAEIVADATARQFVKVHRIAIPRVETRAWEASRGLVKLDDPELRDFVSFLEKMP